jgi:hypothetical protein
MPYLTPDMATFIQLENGFSQAFNHNNLTPLKPFYNVKSTKEHINILHSNKDLGWGQLQIHSANTEDHFLQVPHRFYDKWTATIAKHWFSTSKFKALMINSVHRHAGKNEKPEINSDFSSTRQSPFLAATRAFIAHFYQAKIIQLHGFSKMKRRNKQAQTADVILSYGAELPSHYLQQLTLAAACIEDKLTVRTLIYGKTVNELGGTRNVIAKALQQLGYYKSFIHIELSGELRNKLRHDKQQSLQLLYCIMGPEL